MVGNFKVSKCWDIVIQRMKMGTKAKFTCPYLIDQGRNREWIDDSHEDLIEKTDITYEVQLVGCEGIRLPDDPKPIIGKCYYFTIGVAGKNYGLSARDDHMYGGKFGIHDIVLENLEDGEEPHDDMKWVFDKDHATHLESHPEAVMFESANANLITLDRKKIPPGRDRRTHFSYNETTRSNMKVHLVQETINQKIEQSQLEKLKIHHKKRLQLKLTED